VAAQAILRSAGLKARHDEEAAFREEQSVARAAARETRFGLDWFGFVVSFKGVLLEGLEVVFIVLSFGLNADAVWEASAGAGTAGLLVVAAGLVAHRPLSRVPENSLKFVVRLLLTTFGTFWAVQGLGSSRRVARASRGPEATGASRRASSSCSASAPCGSRPTRCPAPTCRP